MKPPRSPGWCGVARAVAKIATDQSAAKIATRPAVKIASAAKIATRQDEKYAAKIAKIAKGSFFASRRRDAADDRCAWSDHVRELDGEVLDHAIGAARVHACVHPRVLDKPPFVVSSPVRDRIQECLGDLGDLGGIFFVLTCGDLGGGLICGDRGVSSSDSTPAWRSWRLGRVAMMEAPC